MHKIGFVPENQMHEILWYLEIKTEHLIQVRSPNQIVIKVRKKKTCHFVDSAEPTNYILKMKENEPTIK